MNYNRIYFPSGSAKGHPMYEDICYDKPFLRQVIARIDFITALEGVDKSLPQKLASDLARNFPIPEPADNIARHLEVTAKGVQQSETRFKQWNFFGREREKHLAIAPTFTFISYQRYTTFENMQAQFGDVTGSLLRAFPDITVGRFGLRYINVIEDIQLPDPTRWEGYIAPKLLESRRFFDANERLTRLMHASELKFGDVDLNFQFGMPNPDHPAVIRRPQYVLDLDAYVQTAHSPAESLKYMEQAHGYIQKLFESSITDQLRERMHVRQPANLQA
jgi:uncharacterized protein (TIGR04255 family)